MASGDGASPPLASRSLIRLLFSSSKPSPADRSPLIPSLTPWAPRPLPAAKKEKGGLASAALRRFGCASEAASQAYAPGAAALRSPAGWQDKRPWRRVKRKEEKRNHGGGDVWCAPGLPFAPEASVDCVASHSSMAGSGRPDAAERNPGEGPYFSRRGGHQEQTSSFTESPSNFDAPWFGHDLARSGHLHHVPGYHRTPGRLEEIMMFQTRFLLGRMDMYDQYQEWQLDVDNMTYEELLELGNKIGYVNTGLKEEEIISSLRKVKHSFFDALKRHFSTEIEGKCSICQEDYGINDEIGELECRHRYHIYCIKQWLLQKNACPVCKTSIPRT